MTADSIFNETELTIFHRQTGFTFSDIYQSSDKSILAIDHQSNQIFIGDDLVRSYVHPLNSLKSVRMENGKACLEFQDSAEAVITVDGSITEEMISALQNLAVPESVSMENADGQDGMKPAAPLGGKELAELYYRLATKGRSSAVHYLVKEIGMDLRDAGEYLDDLMAEEEPDEKTDEAAYGPNYYADGTMTPYAITETIKKLKPGSRIHLEYKPLIGKLRVLDTTYCSLSISLSNQRYSLMSASGSDFNSLMEDAFEKLFEYTDISFLSEDGCSEDSCHLKRVKALEILH